ncbi:hypothetical protein BaRGS_00008151 [Batillaria attramentaria]|uniref:FAM69 protein-kinase domain-containing protein n=1 Tax=Batillaria attramentaria TaxID=370345 RepID=A0ABD0LLZ4_9CAEN
MTARQRFLCSESAARQEIRNLCQLYENGVVTGDLCSPLCRTGLVSFTGCGYQGKQKRESDALKVMWGQGTEQDMQLVKYASAVWRSLSLLLPQTEYVLAKAFQDTRVFPRIYGSCGHFYIQESCPSLGPLSISSSFVERAKFALGTLHFLQRVETNMPDHPIMCDLKLSNLGVCSNGEIRSTDSNSFMFESTVPDVGCSRNSHCNFGTYCKFTCNVKQGKCVKGDNINLQMVCSYVLAFPANFGGKTARLLHDPPPAVAADLKHVLSECVALQPGEERRIMEQLKTVFNRSLLLLENGRQ